MADKFEEVGVSDGGDQQEQDIPIEQLLAMYGGYPGGSGAEAGPSRSAARSNSDASQSSAASDDTDTKPDVKPERETVTLDDDDGFSAPAAKRQRRSTLRPQLAPEAGTAGPSAAGSSSSSSLRPRRPERAAAAAAVAAAAAAASGDASKNGTEESESSSSSNDEDAEEGEEDEEGNWRKTIMIGSAYQAQVPEGLSEYGDSRPYQNRDKLLWDPSRLSDTEVEDYLKKAQELRLQHGTGVLSVPNGSHTRDHEQALYQLHQCGHNVSEALRRIGNRKFSTEDVPAWSEDECANFENGLRFFGKDFYTIQQQRLRSRSIGELVQFYYLWKKTERHDVFAYRVKLDKRKYAIVPGLTDYMDRFLDEQDREVGGPAGRWSDPSGPTLQVLMSPAGQAAELSLWQRLPAELQVQQLFST